MNLTIVALSAAHLSCAPLFAAKRSLTLSRCVFSRYFSAIFFNSYGRISRTTFRHGLSAAISVNEADQGRQENHQNKNGTIILSQSNIRSESAPERVAVNISSPNAHVRITECGVETWSPTTAAPIVIFAASLKIEGLCIFNCSGGETGAIDVNVSATAEISFLTAVASSASGIGSLSLYRQTVRVTAESFTVSSSNVTLYKQTKGGGVSGFDVEEEGGNSSMNYVLIQNCSAAWAVQFASEGATASVLENLNIIHTEARTALMSFHGPCNVNTSCFMGNTGAGAHTFTASLIGVTFTACITDQEFVGSGMSVAFEGCRSSAETTTIAFVALNTLQCVGQSSNFFENFTTEEIIANIICAFGLAVALIETALYFMKEGLCADKEVEEYLTSDEAAQPDDSEELDDQGDEPGTHHRARAHRDRA